MIRLQKINFETYKMKDKLIDKLSWELMHHVDSFKKDIEDILESDSASFRKLVDKKIRYSRNEIRTLLNYILWLKNLKNDQTTENKL